MKSLGEKNNEALKFEKCNKKIELENSGTPKRIMICSIQLKMDDIFKDSEHNKISELPKTSKSKRKASIFDNNNIDKKKKKYILKKKKKQACLKIKNLHLVV